MWYNGGNIWFWQFSKLLKIGGGAHYYWPAATAGTGTYAVITNGTNVNNSICPKNWKLPTGSQKPKNNGSTYTMGQINTLLSYAPGVGEQAPRNSYTSMTDSTMINLTSAPYSLVRSGNYDYSSGILVKVGNYGLLWSSTASNVTDAYQLGLNAGSIYPGTGSPTKGSGNPVRCIYAPTMQSFSAYDASTLEIGDTIVLTDARDGHRYLVGKLADGNVWMTQNLALGPDVALDSNDSNLPSGVTYTITDVMNVNSDSGTDKFVNSPATIEQMATNGSNGHIDKTPDAANNTGYFYSWTVAKAGYTGSDQTSQDICPKNWRLPTGGPSGEFKTLYHTYYSSNYSNFKTAWPMTLVGYYDSSGLRDSGSYVGWWSSTLHGSNSAYYMYADSSGFGPENNDARWLGYSVRCVVGQ